MTLVELVGALISAWAVWLTAQRRPWCWPVGLASVLVYGGIFVEAKLYSDALLQLAFAGLIVYGWLRWRRHLGDDGRVQVARLSFAEAASHVAIATVGALALGFCM
ncbi:MAG TPA: nicotinamide mononucleotide transporter family protein, partial [Dyella sp.]|nr:nicotinamide mononucleotide transporter family protein [Dyella sp.]